MVAQPTAPETLAAKNTEQMPQQTVTVRLGLLCSYAWSCGAGLMEGPPDESGRAARAMQATAPPHQDQEVASHGTPLIDAPDHFISWRQAPPVPSAVSKSRGALESDE